MRVRPIGCGLPQPGGADERVPIARVPLVPNSHPGTFLGRVRPVQPALDPPRLIDLLHMRDDSADHCDLRRPFRCAQRLVAQRSCPPFGWDRQFAMFGPVLPINLRERG
jgi:hypothetical protein